MEHPLEAIFDYLQYDAEKALQLRHRIALVNMWTLGKGVRVLEVGCGQGETTIVLAAAVGASGRVLAVDNSHAEYGRPVTLGKAHAYIKSSTLGSHIEFLRSTDVLDPHINFPDNTFDWAVFSHSPWYMSSPQELSQLFARVRPWARRLGYAEWDARAWHLQQLPHLLAALVQAQAHRVAPQTSTANVRTLILPEQARSLAAKADWSITAEQILDTSIPLGYGKTWEIHKAIDMAAALMAADDVAEDLRRLLALGQRLLCRMAQEPDNMSLSTYAFVAV